MFNEYPLFMMLEPVSDEVLDELYADLPDGVFDNYQQYPSTD